MTTPAAKYQVVLRDVVEADLAVFFEHQRDPEANRMASFPARDHDAFTAHWNKILADETLTTQAILVDGEVAGNIVSWVQDGDALIGYWIGRDFWGRGIATQALARFCELLDARPLLAHVAKDNIGSVRVLEKCGFTVTDEHVGSDGVAELTMRLDSR